MHGLVPEVLIEDLSAVRRSRLHLRLAAALGEAADPAVRSHHYVRSGLPEALEPAVELSRTAARQQATALAYEQASRTLLDVLGLIEETAPERDDLSGWLYSDLAGFRYEIGEIEGRRDAAARAGAAGRRLGDIALLQQAAIHRAGFPQAGHPDPLAVELLEEAIERTPDSDTGVKAELLSVLAYYRGINEGRRSEADALARTAISIARTRGSDRDLAEALAARSFLLTGAPGVEEHLGICGELASLVGELDSEADRERHQQYVHRQRGPLLLRAGDVEGFVEELEKLERFGRERRSWIALATSLMWRGMLAHMRGDLEAAERHYEDMAEVGKDQANFAESYALSLFVLRRDQGRLGELLELARTVVATSRELRSFEPVLAAVELACDNRAEAEEIWRNWSKESFARLPKDVTESAVLPLLAELCIEFGTPEDAAVLTEIIDPYRGELIVAAWGVCCLGAADRYRSMLQAQSGDDVGSAESARAASELEAAVGIAAS
jgi:tetratricopeptide (TPR) repeat protein